RPASAPRAVAGAWIPSVDRRAATAAGSRPATAASLSERGAEPASQRATSVPMLPRPAMPTARGARPGLAIVDDQVADLAHLFHGVAGAFAPETRFLPAPEGHVVDPEDRDVVDHEPADFPFIDRAERPAQVLREDAALQAVARGRAAGDGLVEVIVGVDGEDRAEDLLVLDLHAGPRVGQDRGFHHRTLALPAAQQAGALRQGFVHPGLDPDRRALIDHGADVDPFLHRVAHTAGPYLGDQQLGEPLGDAAMDEDALDTDAVLAAVDDAAAHATGGGVLEIGVLGNDDRAVAAQ